MSLAAENRSLHPIRLAVREPNVGIPGPRLPTLVQSLLSPWLSLERGTRYVRRYGDIFRVRVLLPRQAIDRSRWPLVPGDAVIVTSPALIREVIAQTGPTFLGGEGRRFLEWFLGPESLMVTDGPEHLQERRQLLSLFSAERLVRYQTVMRDAAQEALGALPGSGTLALASLLDDVVFDVAARLVFGRLDSGTVASLRRSFHGGVRSAAWAAPVLLFPRLLKGLGVWRPRTNGDETRATFLRVIAAETARRRGLPERDDVDLFGQLLRLDAERSATEVGLARNLSRILTIIGGIDTVAVALSWCCYHLLQQPEKMARAYAEARATEPPSGASYIEAACLEAIRIHPAIPILVRIATAPLTLGGHRIHAGTVVVGGIGMAHRREEVFAEPDRFRPERFLDGTISSQEFMPFGGGIRRCLGHAIALPLMSIVLRALLRAVDMEPLGRFSATPHRRWVMMAPKDPLRVAFSCRH